MAALRRGRGNPQLNANGELVHLLVEDLDLEAVADAKCGVDLGWRLGVHHRRRWATCPQEDRHQEGEVAFEKHHDRPAQ